MTTHRRYYFEVSRSDGHEEAWRQLRHACETCWWYNEPEVSGQDYDVLALSFTVSARDQWWAHSRAMKLAIKTFMACGVAQADIPAPIWEPLAPHMNRGRYRVPQDG